MTYQRRTGLPVFCNVLEMVGNSPMLKINKLDTGCCELYLKLENQNPGGSVKDRIALSMIEDAESRGLISPGDILVEATAGNTGLGLALIAKQKGYKLKIVLPDKMSQEKVFNLRAMGAEVIMTRSDVEKGHPEYYQDLAKSIAEKEGAFYVNQFGNKANAMAHEEGTAPEIWDQLDHKVDAVVCGVGSGGTITGIGRFMKSMSSDIQMILADPTGSILADIVNTGKHQQAGAWLVEGIGEDFVPDILDLKLVDKAYSVSDEEAFNTARELLNIEGIMAGSSTGVLLNAALRYCQEQTELKRVVTLVPDTGNKYLSKMYNDHWMRDQGFLHNDKYGDLRDLISRPYTNGSTVILKPEDSVKQAITLLKQNDVSQLPVIKNGVFVGIVDERILIRALEINHDLLDQSVRDVMDDNPRKIPKDTPISKLSEYLTKDNAVFVLNGNEFLGVISRIDLINHLREEQAVI